jgi:hypothetical protein
MCKYELIKYTDCPCTVRRTYEVCAPKRNFGVCDGASRGKMRTINGGCALHGAYQP